MLSCSSDGTLLAWHIDYAAAAAATAAAASADAQLTSQLSPPAIGNGVDDSGMSSGALVHLALPVNDLHLSAEHGMLACASDAQVLTFIDMRA